MSVSPFDELVLKVKQAKSTRPDILQRVAFFNRIGVINYSRARIFVFIEI